MSKVTKETGQMFAGETTIDAIAESQRAEWKVDYYKRHFEISTDQVTGLSKWLTASLFAANSGGLLTLLNKIEVINAPKSAGIAFVVGLIFSLFSATANQELYNRLTVPLGSMISYWQEVRITGLPNIVEHDKIKKKMNHIWKWAWIGPTVGWISGLCFIAGVILVVLNLK